MSVIEASPGRSQCSVSQSRTGTAAPSLGFPRAGSSPTPRLYGGVDEAALRRRVLAAFGERIEPVAVSPIYRLGLGIVALSMILLPLIYLGLVAITAYSIVFHVTEHLVWFRDFSSPKVAAIAYGALLFVGVVLLFFLLKPLLSRRAKSLRTRPLERSEEPVLYAFVEEICRAVRAPLPVRIDVDCRVNAAAGFRRGWRSLLGQDLVLTLGLPLIVGLSAEQLAGVLAHEMGHFAQGAGMRLTYIIRSVNHWFMRVVYERDAWDERLERAAADPRLCGMVAVVWVAQALVWGTRRILRGLMWIGQLLSSFLLRQMEFDADRHEVRLVGVGVFESTCQELMRLRVSHRRSLADLHATWRDGQLIDDLPALICVHQQQLEPAAIQFLAPDGEPSRSGWLDTHPSTAERIANARREDARPIFRSDLVATRLFSDFGALCRKVSSDFYESILGVEARLRKVRTAEQVLARRQRSAADRASLDSFFFGAVHADRALPVPSADCLVGKPDLNAVRDEITVSRSRLEILARDYAEQRRCFEEADRFRLGTRSAAGFLDSRIPFEAAEFGLVDPRKDSVQDQSLRAERTANSMADAMLPFEMLAASRLRAALQLISAPLGRASTVEIEARLSTMVAEVPMLLRVARSLGSTFPTVQRLRREIEVLGMLLTRGAEARDSALLYDQLSQRARRTTEHLASLRQALSQVEHPFDQTDMERTLDSVFLPTHRALIPDMENLGEGAGSAAQVAYVTAREAVEGILGLHLRVMARLGAIAECLEKMFVDP